MKNRYNTSIILISFILLIIADKFLFPDIMFSKAFSPKIYNLSEVAETAAVIVLPEESTGSNLQEAVDNAVSGDTIEISGNMAFDFPVTIPAGKEIAIQSAAGSNWTCKVNGSGTRHFILNGTMTLTNITLDGSKVGGGMYVNGGTFIMHDGAVIQNCNSYYGGGMELRSGSMFTMAGGAIRSNSSQFGGGVFATDSTFDLTGGMIYENYSAEQGGGVFVQRTSFSMQNAVIENNTSVTCGGGVNLGDGSLSTATTMRMGAGAHIRNNKADASGGGIQVGIYGSVTMQGGAVISGNISKGSGGGVKVYRNSELIMESGAEISNNTSAIYGGGVWIQSGRIKMDRGATLNGNSSGAGGGIHFWYISDGYEPTKPNVLSGSIVNNMAEHGGGIGIYKTSVKDIKFQLKDINISGNTVSGNGGGIYIPLNAMIDLSGISRITSNAAGGAGGGIYTEDITQSNLSIGTETIFSKNTASEKAKHPLQ